MFAHSLFGIFLHPGVEGAEDFQTVGIHIVWFAVLLHVLVAPSIQRVCLPCQRVDAVLHEVPRRVFAPFRFLCHHVLAQEFAEIRCYAVFVVGALEVEGQRLLRSHEVFAAGYLSRLEHLSEHHVASLAASVGIAHGVEERGVLAESYQRGGLFELEVFGLLAEIHV